LDRTSYLYILQFWSSFWKNVIFYLNTCNDDEETNYVMLVKFRSDLGEGWACVLSSEVALGQYGQVCV
jgi:hypothetical protein